MLTAIQVLRILVGLIAIWQVVGLLPVLTNWLPNLQNVTGGMWAIAFIKLLVMIVFGGAYLWLGKVKRRFTNHEKTTSEARIIIFAVAALLAIGIVLAIAIPALSSHGKDTPGVSVSAQTQRPPITSESSTPRYEAPPTFESEGWTQESTGSTESGPWLKYDPPGTRYSRLADGTIYRFFPPGVRPNAEKANPFALMDSTDRPPQ